MARAYQALDRELWRSALRAGHMVKLSRKRSTERGQMHDSEMDAITIPRFFPPVPPCFGLARISSNAATGSLESTTFGSRAHFLVRDQDTITSTDIGETRVGTCRSRGFAMQNIFLLLSFCWPTSVWTS
jgi:hypothetical protein